MVEIEKFFGFFFNFLWKVVDLLDNSLVDFISFDWTWAIEMGCDIIVGRSIITAAKETIDVCFLVATKCLEDTGNKSIEIENLWFVDGCRFCRCCSLFGCCWCFGWFLGRFGGWFLCWWVRSLSWGWSCSGLSFTSFFTDDTIGIFTDGILNYTLQNLPGPFYTSLKWTVISKWTAFWTNMTGDGSDCKNRTITFRS